MIKKKLSKEVQKKVDEYTSKLLEEQIKMERLVNKDLDYIFLQELIDKVEKSDVVIDIRLADGTELHIRKDKKEILPSSTIGRVK